MPILIFSLEKTLAERCRGDFYTEEHPQEDIDALAYCGLVRTHPGSCQVKGEHYTWSSPEQVRRALPLARQIMDLVRDIRTIHESGGGFSRT